MLAGAALVAATPGPRLLDGFESLAPWQASASDGVQARIERVPGPGGEALALDYDFGQVAGYAYAHRKLPIDFPDNFEITLKVRGTGGANDLQIKFVDASGQNVWWYRKNDFRPAAEWETLHIRARDIAFAWGPTDEKALPDTASMELVIVRGRDGGAGRIEFDDLMLTSKAPIAAPGKAVTSDPRAMDGDETTYWTGRGGDALSVELGGQRLLGGAVLDWAAGQGAPNYRVELSDDGETWRPGYTAMNADGGRDPVPLPDSEAGWLRVVLPEGARQAKLSEIAIRPADWAPDLNGFIASLAKDAPLGTFPRGFTEQPYWTLVGTDGGAHSGLIDEDGAIEVGKGGFSIVPQVVAGSVAHDWADVTATQSLTDGYLPMPGVTWLGADWHLETRLVADETSPRLLARWRLVNDARERRTLKLVLGVRPFQVNPPAQFLSQQGGISPISVIDWQNGKLIVTTRSDGGDVVRTLLPLVMPNTVATAGFDEGALSYLAALSGGPSVRDPHDLASAAMVWEASLEPGEAIDVPMAIPFEGNAAAIDRNAFDAAVAETEAAWKGKLDRITLDVPAEKQAIADTVRTALAHVLMSRDGPQLKPGTRSYNRSWIRDGAMMGDTLLRLGVIEPVREFADWYASKLFDNGKVPCCVDYRGPDPVPENDAQGEFIHLLVQLYRYGGDRASLEREWPKIEAALDYMERQRQSERTPENRIGDRRVRYGLMPPSISHEGYSSAPQYSLWDDFWALTGYKDAAFAARVLEKPEAATIAAHGQDFAGDIRSAIDAAVERFDIDFIPGATSLGDFDATSTTMALDPAGEMDALDPALLARTFDKQWARVMARDDVGADWEDYTPYELRNVSAFVRLGRRAQANALLDFYMGDRRPAAWNGWAEVVGRDPREIRFIGDMPHAWVASDFIRAALDLFAYERGGDGALVLAGGMTREWLEGEGIDVRGLNSSAGTIDLTMKIEGGQILAMIGGSARPDAGYVLTWPLDLQPGTTFVDGAPARWVDGKLAIRPTGKPIRVVTQIGVGQ